MAKVLLSEGAQFTVTDAELLENGDPDTTYTLRRLTRAKHREIVKANTERDINKYTHQITYKADEFGTQDDMIDYVIVGWSGVLTEGMPAPCDREHKLLLDNPTTSAILVKAGLNEILQAGQDERLAREASFREPRSVPAVLGGRQAEADVLPDSRG